MTSIKRVIGTSLKIRNWQWFVLLLLLLLLSGWSWHISRQGKFTMRMVDNSVNQLKSDTEWRFVIKVIDGLQSREFDISREDDKDSPIMNRFTFSRNYEMKLETVTQDKKNQEALLAVWGKSKAGYPVLLLIHYQKGDFKIIPYYNGSDWQQTYFTTNQVELKNVDEDPEPEVLLGSQLLTERLEPSSWQETRLDYDLEREAYFQTWVTPEEE